MSLDNLRHAQYDPTGLQIDDPGEVIRRFPGFTMEDSFIDLTTQSGAPVDTPKDILFGGAKTSPSNLVSVAANGIFTVLKTGPFAFKSRMRCGRVGAAGSSQLFFWAEISLNGGANWNIIGNSVDVRLDNSTDNAIFFDVSLLSLTKGTLLKQRFARSSSGNDSGDLIASTPSTALQALGIPISPSAQTTVYRLIDFPYAS